MTYRGFDFNSLVNQQQLGQTLTATNTATWQHTPATWTCAANINSTGNSSQN